MSLPDAVLSHREAKVGRRPWSKLHHRHGHVHVVPGDGHHHHGGGRYRKEPNSRQPTLDAPAHWHRRRGLSTDRRHFISRFTDRLGRPRSPQQLPDRITTCHNRSRYAPGRCCCVTRPRVASDRCRAPLLRLRLPAWRPVEVCQLKIYDVKIDWRQITDS